ncbi:DUF4231 domain-containing protein [Pseudoalteromonas sp. NZS127_1]|uniref:DUF4231 domain-containing protein n=1 Tax=Pseudoalteromonas sp. NZS127_1 TaxID=2792074 RepID=UPI0018CC9D9B|nr:DUF4231 domain-containing protein [Pseudoalteromonas sp. NZS127_1]MBG9994376.1 DUF4231 domain-containing protein [Pseudoalteromonas sp. NZS127_1]
MNIDVNKSRKYGIEQLNHFKDKAAHNKFESLWCFRLIMVSTLTAPLFVTLTDGFWLSKVTPSVLSAFAAFSTAWLQLRKPQDLWALYRGAERLIEDQITQYDFLSGSYKGKDQLEASQLLVENISKVKLDTHNTWAKKVPNKSDLQLE